MNHPNRYSHIVMTAGISLFARFNRYGAWTREQEIFRFERTNPLPPDGPEETEAGALERWKEAIRHHPLDLHADEPENVSAEYSLVNALDKERRLGSRPQVTLLHTDTLGGRAAALLVQRLIEKDFACTVELLEIADVDVSSRDLLRRSLGAFMNAVARTLDGCDPSYTCFAPIGGYKVMTSLGYLAGAWQGFPTAYLHEDQQTLHEIPPVPIRIDPRELKAIAPLMRRVGDGEALSALSRDEQDAAAVSHAWLFERADDLVAVNAIGRFLMSLPEHALLFGTLVWVAAQVQALASHADTRRFVCQQLRELTGKLSVASPGAGSGRDLQHEWFRCPDGWHLYKGARNGQVVFRIAYSYDGETLRVAHLWTDHDRYERKGEQTCAGLSVDDAGWSDWSAEVHR